jgi:hypothetical protein
VDQEALQDEIAVVAQAIVSTRSDPDLIPMDRDTVVACLQEKHIALSEELAALTMNLTPRERWTYQKAMKANFIGPLRDEMHANKVLLAGMRQPKSINEAVDDYLKESTRYYGPPAHHPVQNQVEEYDKAVKAMTALEKVN